MSFLTFLFCCFALLEPNLYERVDAKLAANRELAAAIGKPAREMESVRWMIGRWRITSRVTGSENADHGEAVIEEMMSGTWLQFREAYSGELQDLGYLTFNPATRQWISIGLDRTGNAVTSIGERWEGNRLVLIAAEANIIGERVVLRQTVEKRSDREYRVLNEEQLGGKWVMLDEYVYTKVTP